MVLGDAHVQARALYLANEAMRRQIVPQLAKKPPRPGLWVPLRNSEHSKGTGHALKLWFQDKSVVEILKSDKLMAQVEQIVHAAVYQAALDRPVSFVTNILDYLIDNDG